MWRKLARGLGCLSYLGVLGVVFALVAYVAFSLFVRGGVTATPELFGLSEEQAVALLADQGLQAAWSDEGRYHEQVPKNHVMMQDPKAGVYVKRNTEVLLTLSRGPQRIEVPDLAGQALQAAQVSLAAAGLTLGRTFDVYGQGAPGGQVVAQRPSVGERVERDAAVDLFVSLDDTSAVFLMPDLIRRDYDTVRRFFEARGFRIGRVSYDTGGDWPAGTVLKQYPVAGHPLRRSEAIALTVVTPEPAESLEGSETPGPSEDRNAT